MSTNGPLPELSIDAYRKDTEVFVLLKGRLVLSNCEKVRTRMNELISTDIDIVHIHMGQLEYVDSAGWGSMVGLKMVANRTRTRLKFLAPSDRIKDILRVSKLDSIFNVISGYETEILRTEFEKDEFLLWRDTPGAKQTTHSTEFPMRGPAQTGAMRSDESPQDADAKSDKKQITIAALEHLRNGDFQKAIECYLKILEGSPDDVTVLNNLGVIYEKQPQWHKKAVSIWNRVLDLSVAASDTKHSERARRHIEHLSRTKPS